MIPLTDEQKTLLNVPGDALRRATLEPFHFDWVLERDSLCTNGILDAKVNSSGIAQCIEATSAYTFTIFTLSPASNYAEQLVETDEVYQHACLFNGHYYHSSGASVWKDNSPLCVCSGSIEHFSVVADDDFYYHYFTVDGISAIAHWSSGNDVQSDVYWCKDIRALRAVRLDSHDVVVLGGGLPSYMSARTESGAMVWSEDEVNGVVSFVVNNDVWSRHYNIETNEIDSQSFWRVSSFITQDGKVGVVYTVTTFGIENNFVSFSVDGRSWSLPIPLEYPTVGYIPHLVVDSQNIYAISSDGVYVSPGFELFGITPTPTDITDSISSCDVTVNQRTGVNLVVRRSDVLDDLLQRGSVLLKLYAGYIYARDTSVEHLIFTGEEDNHSSLDSYVPDSDVSIAFRDITSWLDRTTSPITIESDPATCIFDPYNDDTGTGYGGLSRTAAYKGSWKTVDGNLTPLSDGVNLALNTSGNNINGVAATAASITDTANDVVGIAYRAVTHNILLALLYRNGTIVLERRNGDQVHTLDQATVDLGTTPKLMVDYRYGQHIGFYSTDGRTWTQAVSALLKEHFFYGATGLLAEQIVEAEVPDPWQPPDWEIPFDPPIIPDIELGSAVAMSYGGTVFVTLDAYAETVEWTDITADLSIENVTGLVFLGQTLFAAGDGAVAMCMDVTSPAWVALNAPGGMVFGNTDGKRPMPQRLADELLLNVYNGIQCYAWIIDQFGDQLYPPFYVGKQGVPGTRHLSWNGSGSVIAGHCDIDNDAECTGGPYDSETFHIADGDTLCRTGFDSPAGLNHYFQLQVASDDGCWHYATVTTRVTFTAYNKTGTPFTVTVRYTYRGYGQYKTNILDDDTWVDELIIEDVFPVAAHSSLSSRSSNTGFVRARWKHGVFTERAHLEVAFIRSSVSLDTSQEICLHWESVGAEHATDSSPLYVHHIAVPVGYTGDLDDILFDICNSATCDEESNCCAISGDLRPCPEWAVYPLIDTPAAGLLGYDGSNILFTPSATPCEDVDASAATANITEQSGGRNIVTIGIYQVAVSADLAELEISADGFETLDTVEIPEFIGTANPSCAQLWSYTEENVLVYGTDGVGYYTIGTGWTDITGNLIPGSDPGGYSTITSGGL